MVDGSIYQVVAGVDTTIDGVPVKEYPSAEGKEGLGELPMSEGQAAAIAFAKTAERIQSLQQGCGEATVGGCMIDGRPGAATGIVGRIEGP